MKKEGKIFKSLNAIIVIFAFFYFYYFASSLNAAVPQILSFQGRLTDASGNLIGGNGANRYFKFEIHSTATGDNELWNSGVTAITIKVTQGVFNTLLGDTSAGYSALDLDFDSRRIYLEVQVSDTINSGFETLVPRQRIVASGFAINAETVHGGRFINATGVGQFGGLATVAYSRFGTGVTSHAGTIDASNDLLISGGLEVNGSTAFDGFVIFGSDASVSGNFDITGTGSSSYVGSLTITKSLTACNSFYGASLSDCDADNQTLAWDAARGTFSCGDDDSAAISADSIDFTDITDTSTLDANWQINRAGFKIGIGSAPTTVFEVQGTASASYLLTGNTLQVGGFASVAYSRFGTGTTSEAHYITGSDDLFITGDLEVNGSVSFAGPASISNALLVSTLGQFGKVGVGDSSPDFLLD